MNNNLPGWKVWCLNHLPYSLAIALFALVKWDVENNNDFSSCGCISLLIGTLLVTSAFSVKLALAIVIVCVSIVLLLMAFSFTMDAVHKYKTLVDKEMKDIPERKDKEDE